MTDTVATKVLFEDKNRYIVHLTGVGDTTGESAVIKVDKSAIGVASDGAEAASLDIEEIEWSVAAHTSVKILWDHTTDDPAFVCPTGSGRKTIPGNLVDPRSSGGTGDILLTSSTATGGAYSITLSLYKNPT